MTLAECGASESVATSDGNKLQFRTFQIEKAIEQVESSADVEHLLHWLSKYDRFSSAVCSCRMSETVRGGA